MVIMWVHLAQRYLRSLALSNRLVGGIKMPPPVYSSSALLLLWGLGRGCGAAIILQGRQDFRYLWQDRTGEKEHGFLVQSNLPCAFMVKREINLYFIWTTIWFMLPLYKAKKIRHTGSSILFNIPFVNFKTIFYYSSIACVIDNTVIE